jgi:hypothetical protein
MATHLHHTIDEYIRVANVNDNLRGGPDKAAMEKRRERERRAKENLF